MIELEKEYTYQDICNTLGWKIFSGGKSKARQIKCIEESFEFYHPINKNTKKPKKSYIFTKIIKEPLLIDNRGGARVNSGGFRENAGKKKLFSDEEFEYLWRVFVCGGYKRNVYHEYRENYKNIFFSNSTIYKEFGFDYYKIIEDIKYYEIDTLAKKVFQDTILDCVKSQTITRLCKRYGYKKNSLPKNILRSRSKQKEKQMIADSEQLPIYNQYLSEELKKNKYKNEKEAIDNGKYWDIIQAISHRFEVEKKMYNVRRYNCIKVDDIDLNSLGIDFGDRKTTLQYKNNFQHTILESVEKSIKRRIEKNEKYKIRLNNTQKKLLNNYLQQLLGKEPEESIESIESTTNNEISMDWLDLL